MPATRSGRTRSSRTPGRRKAPGALRDYQRKRRFEITPEPAGTGAPARTGKQPGPVRFVVQKHAASRLHYDFRLEIDGVLASWAIPKGPSLDPAEKRLAVHVEDHPLEYFDFEGRIPEGEYGGGTVMIWDWGSARWLDGDPQEMLKRGDLKFELFGRKLSGAFALVGGRDGKNWLLIKKRDEHATPGIDVAAQDRSVLSSRSMEEIASAKERIWHRDRPAGEQGGNGLPAFIDLSAARRGRPPSSIAPMMATPSRDAFADPDWLYELKLDGFRLVAVIREGKVRLLSRRGNDAGRQFPELQELSRLVQPAGAIIDGEIVALGEDGSPSFSLLQQRTGWKGGTTGEEPHASVPVRFYAFDILHYEGLSLLRVPLRERRRLLQASLLPGPHVSILDSFSGADGPVLYKVVKQQGQEGVLAKRLDSIYEPGRRSRAWLKIKAVKEQDCVVVGFTAPNPGRQHFGSLALAVFEGGKLAYAGLVGSGFDGRTLAAVKKELDQRVVARTPLEARKDLAPRGITWVRPDLLCQVKYTEWTRDHILRQPTFLHMRADKLPTDCERAVPA